jgi:hypothetical protein
METWQERGLVESNAEPGRHQTRLADQEPNPVVEWSTAAATRPGTRSPKR